MNTLKVKSFEFRLDVLDMIYQAKTGHIGGDFSVMDILVTLYFGQMNISPERALDHDRDMFVLSKGHSVEAYYAVLAGRGFFSRDDLMKNYSAFGSQYIGHPNNKIAGIEMNSGSLGHGLPVCVGMALAGKMDHSERRVYTVMGDGELAEGSVWEGFMAGAHYKLDNLCAVIDRNRLQISGDTDTIMSHGNLEQRLRSFDWEVILSAGNDISELEQAFTAAKTIKGRPTVIIADTIKGFGGGALIENKAGWHHKVPNSSEYEQIREELIKRKEAAQDESSS